MKSSKLIVNKFETGSEVRSLEIRIIDDGLDEERTEYGSWILGQTLPRRRERGSSRLIVKIVAENFASDMNLDLCAQRVDRSEDLMHLTESDSRAGSSFNYEHVSLMDINDNTKYYVPPKYDAMATQNPQKNSIQMEQDGLDKHTTIQKVEKPRSKHKIDLISEFLTKKLKMNLQAQKDKDDSLEKTEEDAEGGGVADVNPLDHSLERVKENNARIMENIHLLSRTLDYTKRHENTTGAGGVGFLRATVGGAGGFSCGACGRNFVYDSGLRRHALRHGAVAAQGLSPRWQPVWPCPECAQVWPRRSLMLSHLSECGRGARDPDDIREFKTSSLLQCEFCEKVFTSIPCVLHHARSHNTSGNYCCSPCELTFPGYRAALAHWRVCAWLRARYSFSLQKMLLCDVCDRKFRAYDQLYSHRYKARHFLLKLHVTKVSSSEDRGGGDASNTASPLKTSTAGVEVLVHQCECCGHVCATVSCLLAHRETHHTQMVPQTPATTIVDCTRLYHTE